MPPCIHTYTYAHTDTHLYNCAKISALLAEEGRPRGVMVKTPNCEIVVRELSQFLRRNLMIFYHEGFSDYCIHLYFYFQNILADTAIWMHYMDANKTAGEETRWQLHKNAACNPEQVLAATPHKTPTVRPPAPITKTIQVRRTRHAGHCWRSRDELLWIPTHGRAKAGRPARTYIQQLCEDTGCCPEDLPRAMNDREEWRERVRDIRATSTI